MSLHSSPNISVQLLPTPQAPPPGRFGAAGAKPPPRRRESITRGYASNKDGSFLRPPSTSGTSKLGEGSHVGFALGASYDTAAGQQQQQQRLRLSTIAPKTSTSAAAMVVDKEAVQWIADLYDSNNNNNGTNESRARSARDDATTVAAAAACGAGAGGSNSAAATPIYTSSAAQATMDAAERAAAHMLHSGSTSHDGEREGQPTPQVHPSAAFSSSCTTDVADGVAGAQHSFASTAEGRSTSVAFDDVPPSRGKEEKGKEKEDEEQPHEARHATPPAAVADDEVHKDDIGDDEDEEDDEAHELNETQREGGSSVTQAQQQQQPLPFTASNAPQPTTATGSAGNGGGGGGVLSTLHGMPRIAWKCGMCSYHMLAMDQSGNPLPFATSAFGNLLPLTCPRCQMTHTDWQPAVPFDEHGDHANIRSKLSNKYVELIRNSQSEVEEGKPRKSNASTTLNKSSNSSRRASQATPASAASLVPTGTNTSKGTTSNVMVGGLLHREFHKTVMPPLKPMCYYCSFCQRRLLRVDVNGELIAMDCDKNGEPLPILCPGCNRVHNEWKIRPFQAHSPPSTASSKSVPAAILPLLVGKKA